MARGRRIWNPRMFDHVVMRGNRQNIFQNKEDFKEWFRILHYAYEKYPFTIVAFCVMTNHYHLLIRSPEVPLGKVMSLINWRYNNYYKKKYKYSGYLYDSRYFSEMITDPAGLLLVSRYIHRNPIETTIPMVSQMELYPHSSFRYYKNNIPSPYPFIDLDILPSLLPATYPKTKEAYSSYCEVSEQEIDQRNERVRLDVKRFT